LRARERRNKINEMIYEEEEEEEEEKEKW